MKPSAGQQCIFQYDSTEVPRYRPVTMQLIKELTATTRCRVALGAGRERGCFVCVF